MNIPNYQIDARFRLGTTESQYSVPAPAENAELSVAL
jgi:hypothetical protein